MCVKARIKATGEIVNIAEYERIALDMCDSWGNPIELKPEEVELIHDVKENTDWNQVRIQAAISAMQGFCSNSHPQMVDAKLSTIAEWSAALGKHLIKELKKEQE